MASKKIEPKAAPSSSPPATKAPDPAAIFLQALYKPRLRELIERFSDLSVGEKGFIRAATHAINLKLTKVKQSINESSVGDMITGRKVARDGMSLSLCYRLGVVLSGQTKPENAIALFYLYICGLWAADKVSAQELLLRIQGLEMDSKEIERRLKALELAQKESTEKILAALNAPREHDKQGSATALAHPLIKALLAQAGNKSAAELEQVIEELFQGYPDSIKDMRGLLVTYTVLPLRTHWLNLSYTLNRLTGELWSPMKIESVARSLGYSLSDLGAEESQSSKSAPD